MTPESLKTPPGYDSATQLELMSQALDLPIDPAYREGVLQYLDFTARLANAVLEFPLEDTVEMAPVFRP